MMTSKNYHDDIAIVWPWTTDCQICALHPV